MHPTRIAIALFAAVGAAATFFPWETFGRNVTDGRIAGGWVSLVAFAAMIPVAQLRPRPPVRAILVALAVVALVVAVRKIALFRHAMSTVEQSGQPELIEMAKRVHLGFGVYVVIGAALVVALVAIIGQRLQAKRSH